MWYTVVYRKEAVFVEHSCDQKPPLSEQNKYSNTIANRLKR